jgi:hypothetical protein
MNRTIPAAALAVAILGGALTGCGGGEESSVEVAAAPAAPAPAPAAADSDPPTIDYDNIPGMAMGAPPETASMNCVEKTCDLVFIPPSKDVVRPFGLAVRLVSSDESTAVISVGGTEHVVEMGKTVKLKGATVKLASAPGTVVLLNFVKA